MLPQASNPGGITVKCRHCGSTDIRLSQKSSEDSPHPTYRCRACKRHFRLHTEVIARSNRNLVIGSSLMFSLLVVVIAVAVYSTSDEASLQPRVDLADATTVTKLKADADRGDRQAQYDLGRGFWHRGEYQLALPWIKAAAERGHAEAEYLLGEAYLEGRGVVQNFRTALDAFTQAAHHGHLESEYRLGLFHRDGMGTEPNKEIAYLWLNVAAARGHSEALAMREKLAAVMRRDELARAQESSSQIMGKLAVASGPAK